MVSWLRKSLNEDIMLSESDSEELNVSKAQADIKLLLNSVVFKKLLELIVGS